MFYLADINQIRTEIGRLYGIFPEDKPQEKIDRSLNILQGMIDLLLESRIGDVKSKGIHSQVTTELCLELIFRKQRGKHSLIHDRRVMDIERSLMKEACEYPVYSG
jgi:hypothetical protein